MKAIDKLIDKEEQELLDDEDIAGPCWEVKVDKKNNVLLFLIDNKELYRSVIKEEPTLKKLCYYISFLKTQNISGLKDVLNE